MSRNGNRRSAIPGAPLWTQEFLGRVEDHLDELSADLQMAVTEFRSVKRTQTELEERVTVAESEIAELKEKLRSLTPPSGIPAVTPPEDAA